MRKYEMVEYTDGPRMAQREEGEYVLYDDAKAKIARLAAERDDAIKALSEAAKARGQAEGKLAASEMAGVVEGWKTRAEKAEAEVERLREALSDSLRYYPSSVVECRGDKCRELWCASCFGWDEAEKYMNTVEAHLKAARQALDALQRKEGDG